MYEFAVMVTKGRKSSTWSMTAHATTYEAGKSLLDIILCSCDVPFELKGLQLSWSPTSWFMDHSCYFDLPHGKKKKKTDQIQMNS